MIEAPHFMQRIHLCSVSKICLSILALSSLISPAACVTRENFKTCDQSGFCKRNRAYAASAQGAGSEKWTSPHRVDPASLSMNDGTLSATILKQTSQHEPSHIKLPMTLAFLNSGVAHLKVDEEARIKGEIDLRHKSKVSKARYPHSIDWTIVGDLNASPDAVITPGPVSESISVTYGPKREFQAVIYYNPFSIEFRKDHKVQITLNSRGLFNFEHWRPKIDRATESQSEENASSESQEDESTWWEETFGGNTDSKPRGPESIGSDINFHGYSHVFGLPEHSTPLSLRETTGSDSSAYSDPYRLYNLDVFEYEIDNPMSLYGSIPFLQAHKKGSSAGVFWLNAAETWVDIAKFPLRDSEGGDKGEDISSHWFSESGQLNAFFFMTQTPEELIHRYAELTGFSQLPPVFAIGYHQSRWNYQSVDDVVGVSSRLDKAKIPFDSIWLDIEYSDEKKYFTWNPTEFTDTDRLRNTLNSFNRKLIVIIDPHIKNTPGYPILEELKKNGLLIRDKEGNPFEGWCWPGASYWVDTMDPMAREWWKTLFRYDKFKGTGPETFLWNDMNEPSVFNGPEITVPKDTLHGVWENRDIHNLLGMSFHNATYHALIDRDQPQGPLQRPFVLTRSFFAGSQRIGPTWTGDNKADWDHLAVSLPMILNNGISGYPFIGADVAGYFGNPSYELLVRWYQAAVFYPFFRAHAHIDSRRREPYLFGEPWRGMVLRALQLRYQLLPVFYTGFYEASTAGAPVVRPNFYVFPEDEDGYAIDDQLYLAGSGLLARPVVKEGADSAEIYLSDNERPYYDFFDYRIYSGRGRHSVPSPLGSIPLLMRSGHIFARRDRPRRSAELMRHDPYTLVVVLGGAGKGGDATGTLYMDDGKSFDYEQGAYILRRFEFDEAKQQLRSTSGIVGQRQHQTAKRADYLRSISDPELSVPVRVERVIVVGAPEHWAELPEVWITEHPVDAAGPEAAGKPLLGGGSKPTPREWKASLEFHPREGEWNGEGSSGGDRSYASWAVIKDPQVRIACDWTIQFSAAGK